MLAPVPHNTFQACLSSLHITRHMCLDVTSWSPRTPRAPAIAGCHIVARCHLRTVWKSLSLQFLENVLFSYYLYRCVCVYDAHVCVCVHDYRYPKSPEEGSRSSGAGDRGGYESSDMGAGNQAGCDVTLRCPSGWAAELVAI